MYFKTIKHFTYKDYDDHGMFNNPAYKLTFDNSVSVEFCLLRLLTGGLDIENDYKKYNFSSDLNYFKNPIRSVSNQTLLYQWCDMFSAIGFKRDSIIKTFHENRSNTNFYINVLLELTNALQFISKKRYTQSFLHIYRAFEHISYSFPLIYLQTQKSYSTTYNSLKDFFKDGGNSELAFCKQFIEKLIEPSLLDSTIAINFKENKINNLKVLNSLPVSGKLIESTYHTSIKYRDVWDLVVQCRNQYFHHLSGMSNSISSQKMIDSDSFFKPINDIALQLFSSIYLSLILNRM